ncbi:MAG: DUF47 domain-containing protein [Oscillospiraceae bacterium]|jgi:predicted phosphate transport protein (TIGR00153 family)
MAKKNPYFNDFITMVSYSCQAAEYLQQALRQFKPELLAQQRKDMHEIEHAEDKLKHQMLKRLVKEFVTPIDREDIIQLANELDNVTDKIEDILIRMYMYNIKEVHPAAIEFSDVIADCCKALQHAIKEFPNFQKSTVLHQAIVDVNNMEEKGDAIYIDAVRSLYEQGNDPVKILVWSELFDKFEDCCDTCEHVADLMEMIAMKNS